MRKGKLIALSVLVVSVGIAVLAATQLVRADSIYRTGDDAYESLRDRTVTGNNDTAGTTDTTGDHMSARDIDFGALKAQNEDAAAWLYCPGTPIDYPVMQANDYSYYLNHLYDGTQNANGALFIDYNNAADFSDALTVIYGHHMRSGMMFGSLKGYKGQDYYDTHPTMYLYTKEGDYRLDLIYGCVIDEGQWRQRAFMYPENIGALMAYAAQNTTFASNVSFKPGDRVVALSTCSYEFDDARYVVLGIIGK
jgi:sortase B